MTSWTNYAAVRVITGVDTNILIDILEPDPVFGEASRKALRKCLKEGSVVACEVVFAETATAYGDAEEDLVTALDRVGIGFSVMVQEAALAASRHWYAYRLKGGKRQRIAADFLIGGHALIQCDRFLTRDHGFYRSYFGSLKLATPDSRTGEHS